MLWSSEDCKVPVLTVAIPTGGELRFSNVDIRSAEYDAERLACYESSQWEIQSR